MARSSCEEKQPVENRKKTSRQLVAPIWSFRGYKMIWSARAIGGNNTSRWKINMSTESDFRLQCGYKINVEEFETYCQETAELYLFSYRLYPMCTQGALPWCRCQKKLFFQQVNYMKKRQTRVTGILDYLHQNLQHRCLA